MLTDRPGRAILLFALPMILGNLFQQFYNIVDSVVVGRFVSEEALAAVGASYSITNVFIAVAIGGGVGSAVLISQFFGAGQTTRMKTAVSTTLVNFLCISLALGLSGLAVNDWILRILKVPANVFEDAAAYLRIYFMGLPFLFMYNVQASVFNSLGDSRTPLYLLIFSSLLNIALDLQFYSLDLDPNDSTVWAARVSALGRIPDEDAVLRESRHALELFPGNAYFSLMGSFVLARRDQYPQALLLLDSADVSQQRVSPTVASEVHRVRGDYLEKLGMRDSCMTEYELAIGLDGNNFMAMNNCAYFMALDSINLDRAELYARMATESDSTSTTFIDTYAWVAYQKGDFEKARALIDRAIAIAEAAPADSTVTEEIVEEPEENDENGPSAEIYDHAGDIYFRCGDIEQALAYWRKALAIDPENKLIKKKISAKRIIKE